MTVAHTSIAVACPHGQFNAFLWSTLVAEALGFVSHDDAVARLDRTLRTLETMERHEPSGQFFNWYDYTTGEPLTVWPPSGEPRTPILSSVDNGWLATALHLVRNQVPELSECASALFDRMDFGFYYRPEVNRILFHYTPSTGAAPCCYDTIVSESRIASYIGIAKGELPSTITTVPGGASPIPATGAGRRQNRVASTTPTMGSRFLRGPTAMLACASCPAGVGACLKP